MWLNRVSTFDVIRLDKLENERQNLPNKTHKIHWVKRIECAAHPHGRLNYVYYKSSDEDIKY